MGSKSKSSSSNTTTTSTNTRTNTNTNTKNVNVQGVQGTSVFTDEKVSVTNTDGGAIQGSLQIGSDAVAGIAAVTQAFLEAQERVNDAALGLADGVAAGAGQYAERVSDLAETAATDDTAETIQTMVKWGAGAAAVVAGAYLFKKGK